MVAVRVQEPDGRVLGSTIPIPCQAFPCNGNQCWGAAWIEEIPRTQEEVEEEKDAPQQDEPVEVVENAGPNSDSETHNASEASAATAQSPALEAAHQSPLVPPASAGADGESKEDANPPHSPVADNCTAAVTEASGEADGTPHPSVSPAGTNSEDVPLTPPHAPEPSEEVQPPINGNASSNPSGSDADAAPVNSAAKHQESTGYASSEGDTNMLSMSFHQKVSFTNCFPINITRAQKGSLVLEVITAKGTQLASVTTEVPVFTPEDMARDRNVLHYSTFLTPAKVKNVSTTTVYGIIDFSIVTGEVDSEAAVEAVASSICDMIPTKINASGACGFSTQDFYFPPEFVSGKGIYIVSNVLCIESYSSSTVKIEVVVPEGLRALHIFPSPAATLRNRGERAYFTFTWGAYDTFISASAEESGDLSFGTTSSLHVLVRDGDENKAPIDIAMHGELPTTENGIPRPYTFWVNKTMVSSITCSEKDQKSISKVLPISLITLEV